MLVPETRRARCARTALLLPLLAAACLDPQPAPAALPVVHGRQVAWVLRQPQLHWSESSTPRFHVHAVTGSTAHRRLEEVGQRAESILDDTLERLGATSYPARLELLFTRSREDMRQLLGSTPGGFAITMEHAALVVIDTAGRGPMRHELMHVVSWQLWGEPHGGHERGAWMSEGVATDAMIACQGRSFDALAAGFLRSGELPSMTSLAETFDHVRFESSVAAASFVRHVRKRHGIEAVRTLWRLGPAGARAATGRDLIQLEAEWRKQLSGTAPARLDPASVREHGCERS